MKLFHTLPILCALAAAPDLLAQKWTSLGGKAVDIASAAGHLYALQPDQTVVYYSGGQWLPYPGGGKGHTIDVDRNGTPYVIGTDGRAYRGTGQGWAALPAAKHGLAHITVDGKGVVWATDGYKNLLRLDGDRWTGVTTSVLAIAGDPRGGLLFIGGGARAIRHESGALPGSPYCTDIASDAAGNAYLIGTDGALHVWNGSGFASSVGGLYPRGLSIGSAGELFVIMKADNSVWMWGGGGGGNTVNRTPNAPTPLGPASAYDPPVITNPGQRSPSVRLSWRDNGDPDGDALGFTVQIMRWDPASQSWQQVFNGQADESNGFTFLPHQGLADMGYYSWTVAAYDLAGRSDPPGAACPWQYFMATRAQE